MNQLCCFLWIFCVHSAWFPPLVEFSHYFPQTYAVAIDHFLEKDLPSLKLLFFPWIHFVKNFHRFAFWNLNQLIIHTWINFGIIHFCCSFREYSQPAFIYLFKVNNGNTEITCETRSKLKKQRHQSNFKDVILVSLLLALNWFHRLFTCFHCCLWAIKGQHYTL